MQSVTCAYAAGSTGYSMTSLSKDRQITISPSPIILSSIFHYKEYMFSLHSPNKPISVVLGHDYRKCELSERNKYEVKKVKGFPYSLLSVGPGADTGVQAVSPPVSHPPDSRLPLLSVRLAVAFPAAAHHRPLGGSKLYCLVTEAPHTGVNNLPKVVTQLCPE